MGKGAFGVVKLVTYKKDKKQYAIKVHFKILDNKKKRNFFLVNGRKYFFRKKYSLNKWMWIYHSFKICFLRP